jgi:hypothetical protein
MEKYNCIPKNNYLTIFMMLLSVFAFYVFGKFVGELFYYIAN